ncbi:MAG: hypothetical protein QM669_03085 [Siphonobacter sp.]
MNIFWIKIAIWITSLASPAQIIQRNQAKVIADKAYQEHRYTEAITYYTFLEQTQLMPEPEVILNLAHSAFANKDTALAKKQYARLTRVPNKYIASTALNQLGILSCMSGDSSRAEQQFLLALESNPDNDRARYNYEWLLQQRPPHRTPPPPAKSPNTPSASATAEVQASTRREQVLKSLKQYNLTEEQALRLLEASRNQEIQYLQQHPRKAENAIETREKY